MPVLSNRKVLASDPWVRFEAQGPIDLTKTAYPILPFAQLQNGSIQLADLQAWGIEIDGETELDQLTPYLDKTTLVAVNFPGLRDGRGFSIARLIRARGYAGELRAVGHITRDRLAFLERCGFDSVQLPDEEYNESILVAYEEISVRYQGSEEGANKPLHLLSKIK